MLSKAVDWTISAQFDGQAVKHVEYENLKAERIIQLQSTRIFEEQCKNDENWGNCYSFSRNPVK